MKKEELKQKITQINQKIYEASKKADDLVEKTTHTLSEMNELKKELAEKVNQKEIKPA